MFRAAPWTLCVALSILTCFPRVTGAAIVTGTVQPQTPLGQFLSLTMTIDDTKTRFEITGPDYSYFAFGFNTTTMFGYSLIVEGLDANRTVVEQNLQGIGNPGSPQSTQNINLISTVHNSAQDLTTVVVERANDTGDPNDPPFSTSMTSLPLIYAYNSFATPATPEPLLDFHGGSGRGFVTMTLAPVPEPAAAVLAAAASSITILAAKRRRLAARRQR